MPAPSVNRPRFGLAAGLLGALLAAGCASVRRREAPPPALAPAILPAAASVAAVPAPPMAPAAPEAVYRNPKIAMVTLRAHQDAGGRLLGPQVMYQVVDPGGWNIEAVEQGRGYIPSVNLEVPPGQGSPYQAPARGLVPLPADSPLLAPEAAAEIVITGLMRLDEQPQAEGLARGQVPGTKAVFDEQAGWLLLPPPPGKP
jgi:hypothetical protein